MGRNSEEDLLLVTAGAVRVQGLASSAPCMGTQYTSHGQGCSAQTDTAVQLQMDVELNSSRSPRKAGGAVTPWKQSQFSVSLPMSKDSSQHSTHPTQCCSAHGAERDRAWSFQGAHRALCHPPLLPQEGQSPQQINFFTTGIPGAAPLSLLGNSTSCPIPHSSTHPARARLRAPLPCSWAQHPPNTPTASNQSVSLLPSWYCSCHTPSLSPGVWSNQQCRAMAPHNFQEHGDLRGKS